MQVFSPPRLVFARQLELGGVSASVPHWAPSSPSVCHVILWQPQERALQTDSLFPPVPVSAGNELSKAARHT